MNQLTAASLALSLWQHRLDSLLCLVGIYLVATCLAVAAEAA